MQIFVPFAKSKFFIINCMVCGLILLLMLVVVIIVKIYGIQR
jgi:hypothetical protein